MDSNPYLQRKVQISWSSRLDGFEFLLFNYRSCASPVILCGKEIYFPFFFFVNRLFNLFISILLSHLSNLFIFLFFFLSNWRTLKRKDGWDTSLLNLYNYKLWVCFIEGFSGFAGVESSLLPELLAIRQGLLVGMG